VHNLDRATWALNETPPLRCHGLGGRSGAQDLLGDVFDNHSVVYHYANGVRLYAHCRTALNCYGEYSSIIMGTKGSPIRWRPDRPARTPGGSRAGIPTPISRSRPSSSRRSGTGKPLHCGDYMTRSTMVAIMGQLSCYSGKQITWDEINQSDYFLPPAVEDCTWDMEPPTAPDENGVYPVCAVPGFTTNVYVTESCRGESAPHSPWWSFLWSSRSSGSWSLCCCLRFRLRAKPRGARNAPIQIGLAIHNYHDTFNNSAEQPSVPECSRYGQQALGMDSDASAVYGARGAVRSVRFQSCVLAGG
jgi:hypothetical protein